jgi:hypothetical protein
MLTDMSFCLTAFIQKLSLINSKTVDNLGVNVNNYGLKNIDLAKKCRLVSLFVVYK